MIRISLDAEIYAFCECGESLSATLESNFPGIYELIVKPCSSCIQSIENQLREAYGLKTLQEIYELGFEDGKLAAEREAEQKLGEMQG